MIRIGPLKRLLDLLYPRRCVFCRSFLGKNEDGVCGGCINGLNTVDNSGKRKIPEFCDGGVASVFYEKDVKRAVHAFKFRRRPQYARVFGRMLAEAVVKDLRQSFDIVTYVPVSAKRRRKRGYDQAELLASETAAALGKKDILIGCLEKRRDTKPQFGLNEAGRRANVLGAFRVKEGVSLNGKAVLIVDDILTTGATLSECAGVLKFEGAERVFFAAFSRAGKEKK